MREHLISGSAAIVFADGLSDIVWCNAEGVLLIGADNVRQAIDGELQINSAMRRQMASALAQLGNKDGPVGAVMRLRRGFKSGLVGFTLRAFPLPDGERGLLLLSEPLRGRRDREDAQAQRMVDSLDGRGHSSAILMADGQVLAASPSFHALEIGGDVLRDLCAQTMGETDRLVKRAIATAKGALPGGMARIRDAPGRYLLIMAGTEEPDEDGTDDTVLLDTPNVAGDPTDTVEPGADNDVPATARVGAFSNRKSGGTLSRWYYKAPKSEQPSEDAVEPLETHEESDDASDDMAEEDSATPSVTTAIIAGAVATGAAVAAAAVGYSRSKSPAVEPGPMAWSDDDDDDDAETDTTSNAADDEGDVVETETADARPLDQIETVEPVASDIPLFRFAPSKKAVRFAWETDADNMIVSVGREMNAALGTDGEAMIGRTWTDAATALDLDGGTDIDALLNRRDTWSGRTVLWPAADGGTVVPVDLAGLPAYDRERNFKGFNGFGIIRMGDARTEATPSLEIAVDETAVSTEVVAETGRILSPKDREVFDEIGNRLTDEQVVNTETESAVETGEAVKAQPDTVDTAVSADDVSREEASNDLDHSEGDVAGGEEISGEEDSGQVAPTDISSQVEEVASPKTNAQSDAPAIAYLPSAFVKRAAQAEPEGSAEELSEAVEPEVSDTSDHHDADETDVPSPDAELFAKDAQAENESGDDAAMDVSADGTDDARQTALFPTASDLGDTVPVSNDADDRLQPKVPEHSVDTSILARLPIPLLVYRDHELLFANADFYNLTGYRSLEDFAEDGGVESLFGATDDLERKGPGAPIYHRNGERLDVRAHLQHVPWDTARAMLLTLRPGGGPERERGGPKPDLPNDAGNIISFTPSRTERDGSTSESFGGVGVDDLRAVLDTASDGVIILKASGEVRAASRSAEALLDRTSVDMAGRALAEFLAPESRDKLADYLAGISGGGVERLLNDGREFMLRTPGGGLIPVFMTIGRLTESDTLCAVMRDVTTWRRTEEELLKAKSQAETANEEKTGFLARISHEIRTPLNAIIGFSDLMIEERFGRIENDRYRGYLRDIHRSGSHVLDIVNDLLDISKIEAGKLDLTFDACDLNLLVSNCVATMQAQANTHRIIIRSSLSAVVPKVVADQRSLKQIVLNLVSNSIKFTRSGGQVIVSTVYDQSGEVALRVRDTGIGMSAQDLEQAMQPFQQVQTVPARMPARTNEQRGTGLGLPLTRAMAEANRASFSIESEPEEGTLVEIRFPANRVLVDERASDEG